MRNHLFVALIALSALSGLLAMHLLASPAQAATEYEEGVTPLITSVANPFGYGGTDGILEDELLIDGNFVITAEYPNDADMAHSSGELQLEYNDKVYPSYLSADSCEQGPEARICTHTWPSNLFNLDAVLDDTSPSYNTTIQFFIRYVTSDGEYKSTMYRHPDGIISEYFPVKLRGSTDGPIGVFGIPQELTITNSDLKQKTIDILTRDDQEIEKVVLSVTGKEVSLTNYTLFEKQNYFGESARVYSFDWQIENLPDGHYTIFGSVIDRNGNERFVATNGAYKNVDVVIAKNTNEQLLSACRDQKSNVEALLGQIITKSKRASSSLDDARVELVTFARRENIDSNEIADNQAAVTQLETEHDYAFQLISQYSSLSCSISLKQDIALFKNSYAQYIKVRENYAAGLITLAKSLLAEL